MRFKSAIVVGSVLLLGALVGSMYFTEPRPLDPFAPVDPNDWAAFAELAAAVGVDVHVPDLTVWRRDAGDRLVLLVRPQGDVRPDVLLNVQIEVQVDYEGDGNLEFRRDDRLVHREPYDPENIVEMVRIPSVVLEALGVGDAFSWGVSAHGSGPATEVDVRVIDPQRVTARIDALRADRRLVLQSPDVMGLLEAEILMEHGLFTEASVLAERLCQRTARSLRDGDGPVQAWRTLLAAMQQLERDSSEAESALDQLVGRG